ncbi:MAG: hypothetical protein J6U85_08910 [Bacteroidales bacterium]|nr:hypothetical protein [Bacteroidales bacterium]
MFIASSPFLAKAQWNAKFIIITSTDSATLFIARDSLPIAKALGIGAASFASGTGFGDGKWDWDLGTDFFERDENLASKDIAESPTALPERPDSIHNA